jgi:hypothetical protein
MKAAAGGIARIYLPRDAPAPLDSADPASATVSPPPAAPPVAPVPVVISIPHGYPPPYRLPRR